MVSWQQKRYEKDVKGPFNEFVAELIEKAKEVDADINLEVKNALFRINRDIRFSKDKSPYKLHMGAVVSPGGRKNMQIPGIYIHVEAEKLMLAGGCYQPDKVNLQKIRSFIIKHPERVKKMQKDKTFLKFFPNGIGGDKNKILPKEFKGLDEENPLIIYKQFFFHTEYEGEKAVTRTDLVKFILDHYKASAKWSAFLKEAMA